MAVEGRLVREKGNEQGWGEIGGGSGSGYDENAIDIIYAYKMSL